MERRHQETLEARQRALDVFSEKMDSLINIFSNKN